MSAELEKRYQVDVLAEQAGGYFSAPSEAELAYTDKRGHYRHDLTTNRLSVFHGPANSLLIATMKSDEKRPQKAVHNKQ